jgi:vacuolar protein 8
LIASAGAIPRLIYLLGSSFVGVRRHSAGALANLAANADNQAAIVAAGGIPPLVALLGTSSAEEVQENAAEAIMNLALNADNRAQILAAGAEAPLQRLAGSEEAAVKKMAEDALRVLGSVVGEGG